MRLETDVAPGEPAPEPLDRATIDMLLEVIGPEGVVELMAVFLDEARAVLQNLLSAFQERDEVRFREARHTLRGMAASIGAQALVDAVNGLQFEPAHTELGRLEEVAETTMGVVLQIIDDLNGSA